MKQRQVSDIKASSKVKGNFPSLTCIYQNTGPLSTTHCSKMLEMIPWSAPFLKYTILGGPSPSVSEAPLKTVIVSFSILSLAHLSPLALHSYSPRLFSDTELINGKYSGKTL